MPPRNPQTLAEVLINVMDNIPKLAELSFNARSTALNKFSKELGISKFVENFYSCGLIKSNV